MKNIEQLLNNVGGQIDGVKRMIKVKKDCKDVVIQMKAIQSGLSSIMQKYIMENMEKCIAKDVKKGKVEEMSGLLKELTK